MSKLLSEEELYDKLEEAVFKAANYEYNRDWDSMTATLAKFVELIESQKKAFAEYAIGENETGVITNPDSPDYGEPYVNTTADRDEQRKRAGI